MGHYGIAPVIFESVSQTTLTPSVELGTRIEHDGKTYVYAHNAGNSQIIPGLGVTVTGAVGAYSMTLSSTTMVDAFVGVVHHATFATGAYGWVVSKGIANVKAPANSALAAGDILCAGGDGVHAPNSVVTNAVAPHIHGKVLVATGSAGVGSAFVSCLYY